MVIEIHCCDKLSGELLKCLLFFCLQYFKCDNLLTIVLFNMVAKIHLMMFALIRKLEKMLFAEFVRSHKKP